MSLATFIERNLANSHEICCDRLPSTVEQIRTKPEAMNIDIDKIAIIFSRSVRFLFSRQIFSSSSIQFSQ